MDDISSLNIYIDLCLILCYCMEFKYFIYSSNLYNTVEIGSLKSINVTARNRWNSKF